MGIHWKEAQETHLRKLVTAERIGLVTDMDGTISYITENPADAVVTPRNYELLKALRDRLTLVSVVSGRPVRSITERMALPGVIYIGNHGLERCVNGEVKHNFDIEPYLPRLEASVAKLKEIDQEGTQVEDKGVTVTFHYRQTDDPEAMRDAFYPKVKRIAEETDLEFFEGRMIFELRPPVKADKGVAFGKLVKEYNLDSAIYIGDDTTDVAALKMAQKLREEGSCYAIGVGVMSNDHPNELPKSTDLLTSGVPDVESLFEWMLENTN